MVALNRTCDSTPFLAPAAFPAALFLPNGCFPSPASVYPPMPTKSRRTKNHLPTLRRRSRLSLFRRRHRARSLPFLSAPLSPAHRRSPKGTLLQHAGRTGEISFTTTPKRQSILISLFFALPICWSSPDFRRHLVTVVLAREKQRGQQRGRKDKERERGRKRREKGPFYAPF